MNEELPKIVKVVAFSGERVFFELDNRMYASSPVTEDGGNIILFPWAEIFLQYLYEEDIPEPSEEQIKNAENNYYKYGKDAKLLIVD